MTFSQVKPVKLLLALAFRQIIKAVFVVTKCFCLCTWDKASKKHPKTRTVPMKLERLFTKLWVFYEMHLGSLRCCLGVNTTAIGHLFPLLREGAGKHFFYAVWIFITSLGGHIKLCHRVKEFRVPPVLALAGWDKVTWPALDEQWEWQSDLECFLWGLGRTGQNDLAGLRSASDRKKMTWKALGEPRNGQSDFASLLRAPGRTKWPGRI